MPGSIGACVYASVFRQGYGTSWMSGIFLLVDFNEVKKNQAGDDPGQRVEHQYPQEPGPVCLSFFTLLLL